MCSFDFYTTTGTGLQKSKALIAVITTKYLNSKFCTNELYTASSDQKDIFPIMLETIDFSASERSRGVKYVIGSINWTMFGTGYDYQASLEHLVQGLKEHGLGELFYQGTPHHLHTYICTCQSLSSHISFPFNFSTQSLSCLFSSLPSLCVLTQCMMIFTMYIYTYPFLGTVLGSSEQVDGQVTNQSM